MADKYDDSEEGLRKALRNLPRVKAKPDFEQRLARRLANPETRPEGRGYLNIAWRIPVPAYSAAALVILAVVSYYAFFRSGALPIAPLAADKMSSEPPAASENSPAPAGKDGPPAASKVDERERDKEASPADLKKKTSASRDQTKAPSASPERGKPAAEPARTQQTAEGSQEPSHTQQAAQGVSMSKANKARREDAAEETVKLQESPAAAPSAGVAPGQKGFPPQSQSASAQAAPYSVTAEIFKAALDSVHIKDSLRADSLRKARLDSLKKK